MPTTQLMFKASAVAHSERAVDRQHRLAREADARDPAGVEHRHNMTMEGLADIDAGRLIDDDAMKAWADSLGSSQELPPPRFN